MLQVISNEGSIEQPVPLPIPKGNGTVKLPHLLSQPGLVMVVALEMDFVVNCNDETENRLHISIIKWRKAMLRSILGLKKNVTHYTMILNRKRDFKK